MFLIYFLFFCTTLVYCSNNEDLNNNSSTHLHPSKPSLSQTKPNNHSFRNSAFRIITNTNLNQVTASQSLTNNTHDQYDKTEDSTKKSQAPHFVDPIDLQTISQNEIKTNIARKCTLEHHKSFEKKLDFVNSDTIESTRQTSPHNRTTFLPTLQQPYPPRNGSITTKKVVVSYTRNNQTSSNLQQEKTPSFPNIVTKNFIPEPPKRKEALIKRASQQNSIDDF